MGPVTVLAAATAALMRTKSLREMDDIFVSFLRAQPFSPAMRRAVKMRLLPAGEVGG
jgi:hypothetical protein